MMGIRTRPFPHEEAILAPRALWRGTLAIAALACPVALYSAASTSERIAFHTINRATGHRVSRIFVDSETGKPVDKEDQVKGYEVGEGDHIMLDPEEVAAAVPESDKTLAVSAFLRCKDIDDVYFDKPYYLAPSGREGAEAFALIREGMRKKGVAAIARAVLFRRVRSLLVRPHDAGLIATTLNFDYEVRSAEEAFADVPALKIKGEMLDLAKHIITTKMGTFDPAAFDDRYEAALGDLVKAKLEGRKITPRKEQKRGKVVDLMAALRESAKLSEKKPEGGKAASKGAGTRRKAAGGEGPETRKKAG
jgi:DNA end-binding protein Ku